MKISNYQQLLECYVRCEDLFEEDADTILHRIGYVGYCRNIGATGSTKQFQYISAVYHYYRENMSPVNYMPPMLTLPDKLIDTYFSQGKGYEDIQLAAIILAHLFDADKTTLYQITKRRPKDMFYAPLASCMRNWYLKNVPPDSDSGLAIPYYLYAAGDILTTHFVGDHTKHLGGILTDFKTKEQYVIVD